MATLLSYFKENYVNSEKTAASTAPLYHLAIPSKDPAKLQESLRTKKEVHTFKDLKEFKTLEDFSRELEQYAESSKKVKAGNKRTHDGKNVQYLEQPACSYIGESCICAALQKCIENKSFWSSSGLETLIRRKFITLRAHNLVMECISKYNAFNILKPLSETQTKISEKHLIKVVKEIIRKDIGESTTNLQPIWNSESSPVTVDVGQNLCYVLQFNINYVSMREYLKLLNVNEALILLHFLHYVLHIVSPALISCEESTFQVPKSISETVVVQWIDMLLTAQLVAFTTSSSLKGLVIHLKKTLAKQKQFYRDVAVLSPYLQHFQKNFKLPSMMVGSYSIETITM